MESILMIDDSKEILDAFSQICEFKKWKSYLATNVYEGLLLFKENNIDLVIIDYHMPIINGLVGVKLLREISLNIPIIVLTVNEDQMLADKFIEVGASDFALKPIKSPDLISRINVHLRINQKNIKSKGESSSYIKGISESTLNIIKDYMKSTDEFLTISNISENTGLAYQTIHRYIQHLVDSNIVNLNQNYGRVGRPKNEYKWNK